MSTLADIETAVAKLSPPELRQLARLIAGLQADAWDRQIEEDASAGRLDFLSRDLDKELTAGTTKPADEICNDTQLSGGLRKTS